MSRKESIGGGGGGESASGSTPPPRESLSSSPAAGGLGEALGRRRKYREVSLALRAGIRDAKADFSFLRTRGLRDLLKFLRAAASAADGDYDEESVRLFRHSQTIPELQVIPVLFQNTLQQSKDNPVVTLDHILGVVPMKITSPATDSEIALALRVLEGCCLLYNRCTLLAHKYEAIKVLLNILPNRGALEQGACLDALISLMIDCPSNQMDFEERHGLQKVAELLKDEQVDEHIRLKCGEFLLLLIGHVHGRENSPLANIHEQIRTLFGEQCASLIWAASQFGSTLDAEQRQTALHIQARRVVESLEPF